MNPGQSAPHLLHHLPGCLPAVVLSTGLLRECCPDDGWTGAEENGAGAGRPEAGCVKRTPAPAGRGVTGGPGRKTEDPHGHAPADLPHGALSQSREQLLASQVQSHHQVFIKLPLCARELERAGNSFSFLSAASPSPPILWPAAPWVGKGKNGSHAHTHGCIHTEIHACRNMHAHRCAYTGPQICIGPHTWTCRHSASF